MANKKETKKVKAETAAKPEFEIFQMLRTCGAKMEGSSQRLRNGRTVNAEPFIWEEGKILEADDYTADAVCGGGLHGLKNGQGNWSLLDWDPEAIGVIFENVDCPLIDVDGDKVKVQKARIIQTGPLPTLLAAFLPNYIRELTAITEIDVITIENGADGLTTDKDDAQIGSSGDYAKIGSSGYNAKIGSSGDYAKIGSSGYNAKIGSSGYNAKIGSSGDYAKIGSSGDSAQIGSSGDYAKIGSSGYNAKIGSSGDYAKIGSSGDDSVIVNAGLNGKAKIGLNGAIALTYEDAAGRKRIAVGYEGEGLKAGVWYSVSTDGEFIEVGD